MPKTQNLAIDLLRIDGDTQSRLKINQDTVDDYAELIDTSTWPFPPLDVFHDGTDYFVADGFHRLLAGQRAKRGSIPCRVHKGTSRDARIFGMTANDKHGMRLTRADKRACVEWLLGNGTNMPRSTQRAIAVTAGVSLWLVKEVVASRKEDSLRGKCPTPATGGKGRKTPPPPSRGGSGEDDRTEALGTKPKETAPTSLRKGTDKRRGRPPKKLDRGAYYKQWDQAIGPLVRLVDKIADGLGESRNGHHRDVQEHLNDATETMMDWLKVEK